jgi:hypothetical protein
VERYNERVRMKSSAGDSGIPEEAKAGQEIRKMQEKLEGSKVRREGGKESLYNLKVPLKNAASVYQIPP